MTQYLLSVHLDEAPPAPSDEQMQQNYKAVDAFNQELRAAGAWVFAGGLNPPSTASVVRAQGGQAVTTDGPYAETKEQLGGAGRAAAGPGGTRTGRPAGDGNGGGGASA
jgi:hypothetical protein